MRKNDILTKSMENIEDTPSSTVTKAEKKAELNETETVVQFRRSKTVGKSSNRLSVPCFFPASAASASAAAELKGNGTVIPKEAPLQSVIAKRCHASVKDLSKRKELNDADFKKIEEFFNSLHLAGDLVNVVFRVFNYLLVPPVLDAIKMEELECIISSLLNAGYSLERQYPDRLIDLRNTFRNAFLDAKEPWVRKVNEKKQNCVLIQNINYSMLLDDPAAHRAKCRQLATE
ncbi:hypothetical protein Tsp_04117 [Trichinella spiralis]|uniref:hypothetical protein n=1 Tax=Trichinella spiralis TaxID=6334 RepID=UPI0001EFB55B|nr:hypothetical protein Tsp_04117 [Trichinella spiralis]